MVSRTIAPHNAGGVRFDGYARNVRQGFVGPAKPPIDKTVVQHRAASYPAMCEFLTGRLIAKGFALFS